MSPAIAFFLAVFGIAAIWFGIVVFRTHSMVRSAIALLFMCTTMIGLGFGPPVVAMLSEGVFSGTGGLAPALSLLAGMTLPLSASLVMWSRQPYIQQVSKTA